MTLHIQKAFLYLVLLSAFVACTPQKKADKFLSKPFVVPQRLQEAYQISKQTSYSLFDCNTAVSEIRIWESVSRLTNTNALFLMNNSVSSKVFYLRKKNDLREKKVIAVFNCQEQIVDAVGEEMPFVGATSGGSYLTLRIGVDAAIDSLFKLGFMSMQSQPEAETSRVGDGISYVIEVRRGGFYKYVYYTSPELFQNEPARKFVKICQFLTRGKWHIPKYQSAYKK